ncbi:MAG: hypothetical protein H0T41_04185 [Rhodobacteraceae bacterium]|nr:hypothetical protein [Paracoccaceae bacterium]
MLWCETAGAQPQDFEDLAVFVSQLGALGHDARIDQRSVPPGLSRNAQFDLAPYLVDGSPEPDDQVVLVAAHRLGDEKLAALRRLTIPRARPGVAFGSFATGQAMIAARAKLSYVLGQDPRIVDLAVEGRAIDELGRDCPVIGAPRRGAPAVRPRLLIVEPDLRERRQASALVALALSRRIEVAVLTDSKAKHAWIAAHGTSIPFYHYGETLPSTLTERVDLLATFRPLQKNYRLQCLVANLAVSGAALLDGSEDHGIAKVSDAFIRGPVDLPSLGSFLFSDITANLDEIGKQVRSSAAAARLSGARVAGLFPSGPFERTTAPLFPRTGARSAGMEPSLERIIFMPTNGVGLGHAQRCTLVAAELDRTRFDPVFAVFPSCTRFVKSYGFDAMPLVARSPLHAQTHENDLSNYLRLRALADAAPTLVFDGGYVFDSVYRTILENCMRGVWIRRGLWRTEQDNAIALDREKAFVRVIVPTEAFDELNSSYSLGTHVRAVGPVVQRVTLNAARRAELRLELAKRYGWPFDHLVITQLGAGVAADRGAQIQATCGILERRRDVLHLVVVWPTATLQPGWFGWSRSRVVKTHHAGALTAAADLCISAAGYNSFHEALYCGLPAIFLPQAAPFMDDQRARAQAARERGLCALVEPHELMTLEREIGRYLDGGEATEVRRRIAALDLPPPGNADAAALIEEVTHGDATMDRPSVNDRSAGRR